MQVLQPSPGRLMISSALLRMTTLTDAGPECDRRCPKSLNQSRS